MSGDMQELFKEAARIAAVVPESMQEAAFNRALDMLTGGEQKPAKSTASTRRARQARAASSAGGERDGKKPAVDRVAQVMEILRDAAPEVDQETSVQGRSIALLVAAKREADVDGLTSPEIAKLLTEKFRHKTTRQAVTQAMDAAGSKIDRLRSGNGAAVYRVMKAGEDWLGTPADQRTASGGRSRRPGTKKAAVSANKPSSAKKATPAKKQSSSGAGRRIGPKGVLESLIDDGYFSEPRGMGDIRNHVRDQRAISFTNNDLSPTLIRLLREGKLKRSKVEKQYVYTAG